LFEIIGHADLPKSLAFTLNAIALRSSTVSCKPPQQKCGGRTKHRRSAQGLQRDYPSPKILQLARQKGVAITFGLGRARAGRSGDEFRGGGATGAGFGLCGVPPVYAEEMEMVKF